MSIGTFFLLVVVYLVGLFLLVCLVQGIILHIKNQNTYSVAITSVQQVSREEVKELIPEIKFEPLDEYGYTSLVLVTYEYSVCGGIQTAFEDAVKCITDPAAILLVKEENCSDKMKKDSGIVTRQLYACKPEQEYKITLLDNRTKNSIIAYEFSTLMEEEI